MKRILFLFFLLWMYLFQAFPAVRGEADSTVLRRMCDIACEKYQQSDRLSYINQLLKEAKLRRNEEYEATAIFMLCKHYYAANIDSMLYWSKQAIPLFIKEKRYEDMFRVKAWHIYNLVKEKNSKDALDSISTLKQLALELHFPDGIDMANQALANYYLLNELQSEGIALYEEVLADMEKRNAPLVKRVNIIRQLQNLAPKEKRLVYLDRLSRYIDECESQGIQQLDDDNPISNLKYILYRNYTVTYIKLGQLDQAKVFLKKTEDTIAKYNMGHKDSDIKSIYAMYYSRIGDYEKALEMYDEVLEYIYEKKSVSYYLPTLYQKGVILEEAKRYQEAADVFKRYAAMKDSLSSDSYYTSLAELKTQHNLDKLELSNRQMEMEALQSHNQMLYLWGGLVVLAIICCLLISLVYVVHRFSRQLKVAKEKAEEADQMKSAFLANMNHEIRTPLNAIVGFSQILVEEEDPAARLEYYTIIQSNNELLQRLIVDVLDISKIESNSMTLHYFEHDLPALMKEIYNTILLRMPTGVRLELSTCESFQFSTDRNRLTQVLTNLLTNAVKHTQEGFIRFGYELSGTTIRFYVQDTGEGIPQDQMERIFSRFVQLDDWNKGVGLGLAICKGLVMKMRGSIDVTSTLGKGTTFFVTLPVER